MNTTLTLAVSCRPIRREHARLHPPFSKQALLPPIVPTKADDPLEMSTSRASSHRSSIDDGPSKASSVGDPTKVATNTPHRQSNSTHASPLPSSQAIPNRRAHRPWSSEHAKPHGSLPSTMPNQIVSAHTQATSPPFFRASSGISRPSPSFVAAHGEFKAHGNSTASQGDNDCVAQMDVQDSHRDSKNPHGLTLDKSKGYFPRSSELVQGSRRQSNMTQLSEHPSVEDLLRIIAAERLHHMPQKGSNWDRSFRALESMVTTSS